MPKQNSVVMKTIVIILLPVFIFLNISIKAHVATNTDGSVPDNSAMLDIKSTNIYSIATDMGTGVSQTETGISCDPTSGSNNGTFTINYNENLSQNSRNAIITVSGNGISETVTLTQAGINYFLIVNPISKIVPSDQGSFYVEVFSNVTWNVEESCSWIECSPSGGSNNGEFSITYNSNTSLNQRDYIININGQGESATVTVTQQGADLFLTVDPNEITLDGSAGSSGQFSIFSNIYWNISNYSNWMDINIISGQGDAIITVTSNSNNTTGFPRMTTLAINGQNVSTQYVNIMQLSANSISSENVNKFIKLFPNPANNELFIKIEEPNLIITEIIVYNIFGQCVYHFVSESFNDLINFSVLSLEQGIYLLNLFTNRGEINKRFIINH